MKRSVRTALKAIAHPVKDTLSRFEEQFQNELFSESSVRNLFAEIPSAHRGKWIRPIFFFLCQGATGSLRADGTDVAVLMEMLHLASLIHDDVVDGSSTRRGQKTLNALWGSKISVLAGDYLMARVLCLAKQVRWPEVSQVLTETVLQMTRGELNQALQQRDPDPTLDAYLSISRDKTASLFSMAGDLAGLVSGSPPDVRSGLRSFGEQFGLAFQMKDDILDYSSNGRVLGKPVGNDFLDGLINLPAVLVLERADSSAAEEYMRRLERGNPEDWKWARDFVISRGGVKAAEKMARDTLQRGNTFLNSLPRSAFQESLSRLIAFEAERIQ